MQKAPSIRDASTKICPQQKYTTHSNDKDPNEVKQASSLVNEQKSSLSLSKSLGHSEKSKGNAQKVQQPSNTCATQSPSLCASLNVSRVVVKSEKPIKSEHEKNVTTATTNSDKSAHQVVKPKITTETTHAKSNVEKNKKLVEKKSPLTMQDLFVYQGTSKDDKLHQHHKKKTVDVDGSNAKKIEKKHDGNASLTKHNLQPLTLLSTDSHPKIIVSAPTGNSIGEKSLSLETGTKTE